VGLGGPVEQAHSIRLVGAGRRLIPRCLIAFSAIYFPVRFALDTLRIADARYVGLTPAQWASALIVAALPFVAVRQRKLRFAICGVVIIATACACWGGPS
jgi:hypothetical protein